VFRQFVTFALFAILLLSHTDGTRGAEEPKEPAKEPPKVAKLEESSKFDLDRDSARVFYLTVQPGPQTITVKFSSSKCAVEAYVFLRADAKEVEDALTVDAMKALNGQKGEKGSFRVDVPAKTEGCVVFRGAGEVTVVDVRITNDPAELKDTRIKQLEEENAAIKKELAELKKQLADLKKQLEKK
jgi:hypothetical protein